jgi:hypothetical protein
MATRISGSLTGSVCNENPPVVHPDHRGAKPRMLSMVDPGVLVRLRILRFQSLSRRQRAVRGYDP